MDKLSGKDFNRPQYQKLLKKCGPATATRYVDLMLQKIQKGEFDATDIITHTLSLEEGSHAYSIFDKKEDNCIKVNINYICLFDYLFISLQMSAKLYFIGSTGILLLW